MKAALAFLLCLFAAPLALAQHTDRGFAGAWWVETAPHPQSSCVISGPAQVVRRGRSETYDVRFSARESCPGDEEIVAAEQACIARAIGRRMVVRCRVLSSNIEEGLYKPDNFILAAHGAAELVGRLDDEFDWDVPVRWRRSGDALVS